MLLIRKTILTIIACSTLPVLLSMKSAGNMGNSNGIYQANSIDTITPNNNTSLPYPIKDSRAGMIPGTPKNTYDLKSPSNLRDSVVYDAITQTYVVHEKIGTKYYRIPTTYTFDEYWKMRNRQAEIEYFQKRANTTSILFLPDGYAFSSTHQMYRW